MTSHLIPTAITDKNGKQTTVRKKPVGAATSAKALSGAAPSLGTTAKKKKFVPLAKQTEEKRVLRTVYASMLDPELVPLLGPKYENITDEYSRVQHIVKASDMQSYDVTSVVKDDMTARALLGLGIKDADAACEFLQENGLEHLIEDNSHITDELLRRRVSFDAFVDNTWAKPEDPYYLDTIEVQSYKALDKAMNLPSAVSRGEVSLQDIKDVGIVAISKSDSIYDIHKVLASIKSGEYDCTPKQLGAILNNSKGNSTGEYMLMRMMKTYGGEAASSIRDVDQATNMQRLAKKDELSADEVQAAIIYAEQLPNQRYFHYTYKYEMFRAEVPVEFVGQKLDENPEISHEDIMISYRESVARQEGIAEAIVDGWL